MLTASNARLGLNPGELVLDLGCGFGRHAFAAARDGARVIALDAGWDEVTGVAATFEAISKEGEQDVARRSAVVQGDGLQLPFADETFDRVICSEVLEHIRDDESAINELARVLRRGGTMAVTVPRAGPEWINWKLSREYYSVPCGHVRIYRRRGLERELVRAGLKIEGHTYAHGLHSPYWWLKCLVGTTNEKNVLVRQYHRFLVWDIMKKPRLTRWLDRLLNPIIGKSLVEYVVKP